MAVLIQSASTMKWLSVVTSISIGGKLDILNIFTCIGKSGIKRDYGTGSPGSQCFRLNTMTFALSLSLNYTPLAKRSRSPGSSEGEGLA